MPELIVGHKAIDCSLVILDKDGTLVDYKAVDLELARSRRKSVEIVVGKEFVEFWEKAVGINMKLQKIDYRGPLGTLSTREETLVAATAFYLKGCSWEEAKLLAEKAYAYANNLMKPPYGAVLLNGVVETLRKFKEHGLKLAIASTDAHNRIVKSFKILKIADLFDAFVGPEDVANGKPAPDMILEILKQTSCKSNEVVMVGDSMSDMKMGKNAKVKATIGVLTGITPRDILEKVADVVVDSVAKIRIV
jgi:phosphoglycolate phosphatase